AVVHHEVHAAGLDVPVVVHLAAVRSRDRLHALRPLPPRLEGRPPEHHVADRHQVDVALVEGPRLVRRFDALLGCFRHYYPPSFNLVRTVTRMPVTSSRST